MHGTLIFVPLNQIYQKLDFWIALRILQDL